MPSAYRVYSAAEAAAVSGIGVKAVHNAIDKHVVIVSRAAAGARRSALRSLTNDDLVRLKLWYGIGAVLSSERRMRLFREIADRPGFTPALQRAPRSWRRAPSRRPSRRS